MVIDENINSIVNAYAIINELFSSMIENEKIQYEVQKLLLEFGYSKDQIIEIFVKLFNIDKFLIN